MTTIKKASWKNPHYQKRDSNVKKYIAIVSIFLILMLVLVALIPFITDTIDKWEYDKKYEMFPVTETTTKNITIDGANIDYANPNYELNLSSDRQYSIVDYSYIEYVDNLKTVSVGDKVLDVPAEIPRALWTSEKFKIFIVVTDTNGTPIPDTEFYLTAVAHETWGFWNIFLQDSIMLYDNEKITVDGGENGNIFDLGDWGNGARYWGGYDATAVSIEMTDKMLQHYVPFAVTYDIDIWKGGIIFIRLATNDGALFDIQKEIFDSEDYQDVTNRKVLSFDSYGYWDADFSLSTPNIVHGIDTTNLTVNWIKPKISVHDNDVLKVSETRMFNTSFVNPAYSNFALYYIFFDNHNDIYDAELYAWDYEIYKAETNISTTLNDLESNTTYILTIDFIISESDIDNSYTVMPLIGYNKNPSTFVFETVGKTHCEFEGERFITEFDYYFNNYFSMNQEIHRIIYNLNDKINLNCDINTPYYINGTDVTFVIRYFISIPDGEIALNSPDDHDNTYDFNIRLILSDDHTTYANTDFCAHVGYEEIGTKIIKIDLTNTGIQDLTSYNLTLICQSIEDGNPEGGYRTPQIYTQCLYYLLRNFNEFRKDVKTIEDILDVISEKDNIDDGLYDSIKDVLSVMKYKVEDLKTSCDNLHNEYPDRMTAQYETVMESIERFNFYLVALSSFMDAHDIDSLKTDSGLIQELRSLLNGVKFWYADAFTQYNAYVAGLNGETQIIQDVQKITFGYREYYTKKYIADKIKNPLKFLPTLILIMTVLLSFLAALIFYFAFRKRFKSKISLYVFTIVIFIVIAVVIYIILLNLSEMVLYWWYGVG